MIRLTWRQFRAQALLAAGGLAGLMAIVLLTRPNLAHLYDTNVATCEARGNCPTAIAAFLRTDADLRGWLGVAVLVVPALIGVFWGAPLVARELETGTFRLAWTQSVTRSRWLGVKLGLVGLGAVAVAGLVSLTVTWWASRLDQVGANRFGVFDQRGIVPIGHSAFAFMLGVTVGILLRRTVPAMATTVVVFTTVRLGFIHLVRPRLVGAVIQEIALDPARTGFGSRDGGAMMLLPEPPDLPNAWVHSVSLVDRAGRPLTADAFSSACPELAAVGPPTGGPRPAGPVADEVKRRLEGCITKLAGSYHQVVRYQPADRYWTFQWIELGIFLGAAALLVGVSVWWVRRRLR